MVSKSQNNVINLNDIIIRNFEDENAKLRYEVEILETKLNDIEQFGRRNDTKMSGIPDTVTKKVIKSFVISIMRANNIEIDGDNIGACYRIRKPKRNSKKISVWFCNCKISKKALYNKKKLGSVMKLKIGLDDTTKLFISENLSGYNNKLAFKCKQFDQLPSIIELIQGMN